MKEIPIIDLFAGPGGLGEGFSSLTRYRKRVFDIKLSIEKDPNAHKTLLLRAFFRQFPVGKAPDQYYKAIQIDNIDEREKAIDNLFSDFPKEYKNAQNEAWQAELGSDEFPPSLIDKRIRTQLGKNKNWVLIGGPPCQAYSLAGRSRTGGIDKDDHRVYLYKEYLRIIAYHKPAVFVMENVKGLLSASVNGEKVFDWILNDLRNPSKVFKDSKAPGYKVFSLTAKPLSSDNSGNPEYKSDKDFIIQSENYGVPQKRHRVILLGIRNDLKTEMPAILKKADRIIPLKGVIDDLPKIRSGINRAYISSEFRKGKKRRTYLPVNDSSDGWLEIVNSYKQKILKWNGIKEKVENNDIILPPYGIGGEFIKFKSPKKKNKLYDWYKDENLYGVLNHESRTHLVQDLLRYQFTSLYAQAYKRFPRLDEYAKHSKELLPDHDNSDSGKFVDRFRVQLSDQPATTITSHISKDGHYFIHYDPNQCRSLTVREAARIQTFPDNYLFRGSRTAQYHQVGNAVPPYLAYQIAEIVMKVINTA